MPKWTIGQKVEAINQLITGRILEICQNGSVVVETTDGFEMTFLPHEILALPSESFLKNSPPIIRKRQSARQKKICQKSKGQSAADGGRFAHRAIGKIYPTPFKI